MATKQLGWLIALLVATPSLYMACGGDDSSPTTGSTGTGAAAGSGGSTSTGGTGGTGTGGTGTGGAGGSSAGSGGSAGKAGGDSGVAPDARIPCGTTMNGCGLAGNSPICDEMNNRCVQCMDNSHCASQTTNKICDTRPGMNGLPTDRCIQCLDDTQCPSGSTCNTMNNTCVTPCGTTAGCSTSPTGSHVCDATNNRCVQCLMNSDCSAQTTNKVCDTRPNMQNIPTGRCIGCLANADCGAGQVCNTMTNSCVMSCTADTQCSADGGGNSPHCNPTTMTCAECGADSHCTAMQPYCAPAGTCEECLTDAHCASQAGTPYCRTANYTCVQCLTNDHCTPPATCNTRGSCTMPTDGGGREGGFPMPDASGGG